MMEKENLSEVKIIKIIENNFRNLNNFGELGRKKAERFGRDCISEAYSLGFKEKLRFVKALKYIPVRVYCDQCGKVIGFKNQKRVLSRTLLAGVISVYDKYFCSRNCKDYFDLDKK